VAHGAVGAVFGISLFPILAAKTNIRVLERIQYCYLDIRKPIYQYVFVTYRLFVVFLAGEVAIIENYGADDASCKCYSVRHGSAERLRKNKTIELIAIKKEVLRDALRSKELMLKLSRIAAEGDVSDASGGEKASAKKFKHASYLFFCERGQIAMSNDMDVSSVIRIPMKLKSLVNGVPRRFERANDIRTSTEANSQSSPSPPPKSLPTNIINPEFLSPELLVNPGMWNSLRSRFWTYSYLSLLFSLSCKLCLRELHLAAAAPLLLYRFPKVLRCCQAP